MTETVARSPKERAGGRDKDWSKEVILSGVRYASALRDQWLTEEQIDTGTGIMRAVVGITVGGTELYRISLCVSPTTTGLE